MNTKDLTILAVGVGIVLVAYFMKKKGIEGFQMANIIPPTAAAPPPPGIIPTPGMPPPPGMMPPDVPGVPSIPPASMMTPPTMTPPAPAPNFFSGTPLMSSVTPTTGPTTAPMTAPAVGSRPTQPTPLGMQPNQDQIMDIASKVNKMNSDQAAIMAQIQQVTTSMGKTGSEGFQSYHNPYDNHSPGDTQAMEFRLGKKAMADSVVRY